MANTTLTNLPTVVNLTGLEPLLGVQGSTSVQITTGQIVSLATGGGGVGPLVVGAGGTGNTTFTQYEILYGDGTNPIQSIPEPTGSNYVLVASPGVAPAWQENIPVTSGVNTVAFGTTGLTPVAATEGNVAVAFGSVPTSAGIYSPAANEIALSTNSQARLYINSAGEVGIGTTSPSALLNVVANTSSDAVRITQTGAGNAFVVEDSANPDSTPFVINTDGRILTGISSTQGSVFGGGYSPQIQVWGVGPSTTSQSFASFNNASALNGSRMWLARSRGSFTAGVPTYGIVSNGDRLGNIEFAGDDGTVTGKFVTAASIEAEVDGIPGTNDMPGRLVFSTTADGASTVTERMRISSTGAVNIGANGASNQNDVFQIGTSNTNIGIVSLTTISGIGLRYDAPTTATGTQRGVLIAYNGGDSASPYTTTDVIGLQTITYSKGTNQTVTNNYGILVDNVTAGSTNNYGLYISAPSGATNNYGLYVSGASADNYFAGNVGIGTSSPGYKLDIQNAGNFSAQLKATSGNYAQWQIVGSAGTTQFGTDSNGGFIQTTSAIPIAFSTNNLERMRIDSSGNVGIGNTPSGTYKLEVTGAGSFSTTLNVGTSITTPYYIANGTTTTSRNQGAYAYGTMSYSDTNVLLSLQSSVNNYNELVIQNTNSGASASTNIIVSNNSGTASTFYGEFGMNSSGFTGTGSFAGANNVYLASTSSDLAIGTTTSNAIRFVTNSGATDALLIRSDGNIAIGSSTGVNNSILYSVKDMPSVSTSYALNLNNQINSATITDAFGFTSLIYVNSTSPVNQVIHFFANPQSGAVGSSIAVSAGVYVSDQIRLAATTVSNTYAYFGGVNAASNAYNLYMQGSAQNYLAGNTGIGSTPSSATNLLVSGGITGSTTAYAHLNDGVVQSGVTTLSGSFVSTMSSAAASFTTTSAVHFYANPAAGGAGSTITNQYGFYAGATVATAGAATVTNAYGFYGNVAAATNRYNFYAGGTANNYFAGYSFGLGGVQNSTTATATNTATLTATQVASGFIVGTPTATASYTLPTAAALDTELSNSPTGTSFELVVFTTAAFAITLLTATGWTLVGSMATGATANSFARFRARKTGAGAWSLYRVS